MNVNGSRLVVIGAFPTGLRPEHRTRFLESPVEWREPARPARDIRIERVPEPVVVAVGLTTQGRGEHRVAVRLAEPPRAVRPDIHARIAGRDPTGKRLPMPPAPPNPLSDIPAAIQNPRTGDGPTSQITIGDFRLNDQGHDSDPLLISKILTLVK